MRSKGAFSIAILYILVILLVSFLKNLMTYITSSVYILFDESKNVEQIAAILEYIIYFLVYFGFGAVLMIVIFANIDTYKKVFMYASLIILATLSLSMMARSFVGEVDFIKYLFKFLFSIAGALVSFLILERNVRIK